MGTGDQKSAVMNTCESKYRSINETRMMIRIRDHFGPFVICDPQTLALWESAVGFPTDAPITA